MLPAEEVQHCSVLEVQVYNDTSASLEVWLGPRVAPSAATPVWQEAVAFGARLPVAPGVHPVVMNI